MSEIKVGDKVRIRPDYCRTVVGHLKERGWFVKNIGDKNVLLDRRDGRTFWRPVPWEHIAPDIDMPWDPMTPQKTLAEKELEVLQQDPIRRRWQELLGPGKPDPLPETGDYVFEYVVQTEGLHAGLDPSDVKTYLDARGKSGAEFYKWAKDREKAFEQRCHDAAKAVLAKEFERRAKHTAEMPTGVRTKDAEHRPFKKGDRVKLLDEKHPGLGTISILTDLFIEIIWDDGGKTAGAWDPASAWLAHAEEAPKAFKVGDRVRLTGPSTFTGNKIGATGCVWRPVPGDGYQIRWDDECGGGYSTEPRSSLEPHQTTLQKWAKCYEEANEAYERVTGRKFVDATKSFFQAEEAKAIVEAEKRVAEHIAAEKKDPDCNERMLVQVAGFKTGDRVFRLKASNLNSRQEGVIREISAPVRNGKVQMSEAFASIDHDDGSSCCGGAGSVLYSYRPILEVKSQNTGTCTFDE